MSQDAVKGLHLQPGSLPDSVFKKPEFQTIKAFPMDPLNLALFHEMIPLEMCILNADLTILYANAPLTRSTGIHDFSGRSMHSLIPKARLGTLQVLLEKARIEKKEVRYTAEGLIAEEDREVILRHNPETNTFYVVLLRHACEPVRENLDALTGLPTRETFMERAEQLLQQGRRTKTKIAFVFMDLNGFKPVNDTHGHKAGDVVLRVIADRLQDTIRQTDILARFGGDEFVMGLSDLKAGIHASLSVRRLMKAVVQPIDIEKLQVSVSGSFGVAIYPDDSKDIKTLIRYADEAMYRAKTAGLGYAFFAPPDEL